MGEAILQGDGDPLRASSSHMGFATGTDAHVNGSLRFDPSVESRLHQLGPEAEGPGKSEFELDFHFRNVSFHDQSAGSSCFDFVN